MVGSYKWDWYVLKGPLLKIDIDALEVMKSSPVGAQLIDDLTTEATKVLLHDCKVIVERRYTNDRPDRLHTIASVEAWNSFRRSFFAEE